MTRSLRVNHQRINHVKIALSENGYPTQKSLAYETGLSIDTISRFLNCKPVLYGTFEEICRKLNLDWREISTPDFEPTSLKKSINTQELKSNKYQDWGTAVDVSVFYDRTQEMAQLESWILQDRCRLLTVFGRGGVGKTILTAKLAKQIQGEFDSVIWRSLRQAPSFDEIITDLLSFVSNYQEPKPDINKLIYYLRTSRCLIILDSLETVLDVGHTGKYRSDYQEYTELIRVIAEVEHKSCVILTTREKPVEMNFLEGANRWVSSLKLFGSLEAAFLILQSYPLLGTDEDKYKLCNLYNNNPLKIRVAANTIINLFNKDINNFLEQNTFVFSSIRHLLDRQFHHLSALEQQVMYWLQINQQFTTINYLHTKIVPTVSKAKLFDAVERLIRRSLIETEVGGYTQSPIVMEYVKEVFTEEIFPLIN
ncbi:helix-turn-helix domain-containing protein [Nostoc sp. NZL]|uniref:helix-turn-helix domain-containing protein n=1 Tax=Nostoc sp. NZL TaxID=2650612 RepID=UPI0018C46AB6|nr:NB-ARC domain-containing protein [Nostoc sp. NZL]